MADRWEILDDAGKPIGEGAPPAVEPIGSDPENGRRNMPILRFAPPAPSARWWRRIRGLLRRTFLA